MEISRFLTIKDFPLGTDIFLSVDPATQFGYVGSGDGGVIRVSSKGRVLVPVYDWLGWGLDEGAILVRVLVRAAAASPWKVPRMGALNQAFWAKVPGIRAVLSHPENKERFEAPAEVVVSPEVPKDRIIVLKASSMVGYYVKQAARRNILAHNKCGLLSVELYESG
jgi:hypothetical protein